MKFYPRTHSEVKEIHSIVWSAKHGAYVLSSDGRTIGSVVVNKEQYIELQNDNLSCLKDLGYDNPLKYDTSGYLKDSNLTGVEEVRISITERIDDNQLPYGVFKIIQSHDGTFFVPFNTGVESHNIIKNKDLKEMVVDFYEKGVQGRKNKKGILLYGPPGNGKTTEIMALFDLCEALKLRIYIVDSRVHFGGLDGAKALLEKDRSLFILEEITERTNGREIEHLLTFLDGESSWNNSIVLATTNYPQDLPANLVDRPGRFDTFIEYGNPSKEDITNLGKKFELTEPDCEVLNGKGLSFDYCSFIMSKAKQDSVTVKQALETETEKKRKISMTFKGKIGIF